ncbi:hypothetical protein [Paenibacillus sp. MMO-58]|uniref:hypothetical protein n=1 Tax=Paenibacillus sp. MMO-58 TaxID=3081290 RepID=UPI003018505C
MQDKGLKLLQVHPKGGTSPFEELNGAAAVTYAIDAYSLGDVTDEVDGDKVDFSTAAIVNVYIYVFDNEQARIKREAANHMMSCLFLN